MASETSLSEDFSAVSNQRWAITNTGGAPILAREKGGGQAALVGFVEKVAEKPTVEGFDTVPSGS